MHYGLVKTGAKTARKFYPERQNLYAKQTVKIKQLSVYNVMV